MNWTRRSALPQLRRVAVVVVVVVAALTMSLAAVPTSAACWQPPVTGVVIDPFRPPRCPWCPGNRGLEYRSTGSGVVRAVADGEVVFSGSVAGTRYVVVDLANGWRLTYGRLASTAVRRGDRVVAGSTVGTVGSLLFFGLRIDGSYSDPARYIGRWVGRPRLIPTTGEPARAAPPPRLRCRE